MSIGAHKANHNAVQMARVHVVAVLYTTVVIRGFTQKK